MLWPYAHIPHDEGLTAVGKALNNRCDSEIATNDIVDLVELVLKNNSFEFDGKHYLQKRGTAIGTRIAPSYANLFMHDLESKLLAWVPVLTGTQIHQIKGLKALYLVEVY